MDQASKSFVREVLIYFILAFFLSLWLLQFNNFLTPDGTHYARIGVNIFSGNGLIANAEKAYTGHPPFYAFLIGLFYRLIGNLEFAAHFVSILAFALTVFPLASITRKTYGIESMRWVCLLYATNGFLLVYSNMVVAEPVFTFLLMTQLLLLQDILQEQESRQTSKIILFGFLGGLSYLTRPEGLLFFAAGIFSILFLADKKSSAKFRSVFLAVGMLLLICTPYLFFIRHYLGHWHLSRYAPYQIIMRQLTVAHPGKYLEIKKLLAGLSVDKTRIKMDELIDNFHLIDYARKDNWALPRSGLKAFPLRLQELNKYFFLGAGLIAVGASFLSAAWTVSRKKMEWLMTIFLFASFYHVFLIPDPRRYLPIFPILLMWAGHGISQIRLWTSKTFGLSQKKSFLLALTLCLGTVLFSGLYLHHALKSDPSRQEHKEMGLWIKNNIADIEREKIVTELAYISFYSGGLYAEIPYTVDFDDFLSYARHLRANYFVISQDFDPMYLESYEFLLDESKPLPKGIRRLHTVTGKNKISLFKIEGV